MINTRIDEQVGDSCPPVPYTKGKHLYNLRGKL